MPKSPIGHGNIEVSIYTAARARSIRGVSFSALAGDTVMIATVARSTHDFLLVALAFLTIALVVQAF
jgi:hypothetical protein